MLLLLGFGKIDGRAKFYEIGRITTGVQEAPEQQQAELEICCLS